MKRPRSGRTPSDVKKLPLMYSMTMGSVFPFSVTPPALMLMAITLEKTEVDCA